MSNLDPSKLRGARTDPGAANIAARACLCKPGAPGVQLPRAPGSAAPDTGAKIVRCDDASAEKLESEAGYIVAVIGDAKPMNLHAAMALAKAGAVAGHRIGIYKLYAEATRE